MPRPRKPPHLLLRTDRDGRRRWIIRDGPRDKRTGSLEEDAGAAAEALADYIGRSRRPNTGIRRASEAKIADILIVYLRNREATLARPNELRSRIGRLNEFWGDLATDAIKGDSCRRYQAWRGPDAKIASRRELETLRAAVHFYAAEHGLDVTPRFTLGENHRTRERWLTRQEAARLLKAARNSPKHAHVARFILIGLYTATRHTAILRLQWIPNTAGGWIDLERGVLYRRGVGEGETRKRRPPTRIPPRLLQHLRRWRTADGDRRFVVNYFGEEIARIEKGFRYVRNKAGLDAAVTPHVLRHTRCTWLAQANVPIWEAAGAAGMTAEQFERTYGHHSPDFQKRAAEAY